jgi:epoxyqueuosine reductase QueG
MFYYAHCSSSFSIGNYGPICERSCKDEERMYDGFRDNQEDGDAPWGRYLRDRSRGRFAGAPKGFHLCDVYPGCKSVVVFAARFPLSTLQAQTNAPYTLVRNRMVDKLDWIAFNVSVELEAEGLVSVPIPSADPYDYWDADRIHGKGILSLKHAGALGGSGVPGKNTLLVNERLGNMIWLGAALVSIDLEPDPIVSCEVCSVNAHCAWIHVPSTLLMA